MHVSSGFFARVLDVRDEPLDAVAERILDAALEQFQLVGLRRSTIDDVARRARVGRVTVYRRIGQKDELIEAVILRELRRLFATVDAAVAALAAVEDRLAEGFAVVLRTVRDHPLFQRLLAVEPESVLPFLTVDGGPIIVLTAAYVAGQIRLAQRVGLAPQDLEPEPVAEMMARLAHSVLLTPQGAIPLETDEQARAFARSHIAPLVTRRPAPR
jgi:AcrR family transcriptional regulator